MPILTNNFSTNSGNNNFEIDDLFADLDLDNCKDTPNPTNQSMSSPVLDTLNMPIYAKNDNHEFIPPIVIDTVPHESKSVEKQKIITSLESKKQQLKHLSSVQAESITKIDDKILELKQKNKATQKLLGKMKAEFDKLKITKPELHTKLVSFLVEQGIVLIDSPKQMPQQVTTKQQNIELGMQKSNNYASNNLLNPAKPLSTIDKLNSQINILQEIFNRQSSSIIAREEKIKILTSERNKLKTLYAKILTSANNLGSKDKKLQAEIYKVILSAQEASTTQSKLK